MPDVPLGDLASAAERWGAMLLIRRFEERCEALYGEGLIAGFLHRVRGEEAVVTGAASALAEGDAVLTTFRAVPWVLARGGSAERVLAELLGRAAGVAGGRGGATGVLDREVGVLGGFGIPGGHAPLAAGVALSGRLALCQMTAGATAQGVVSESMALAATWELPVVFLATRDVEGVGPPPARTELFERAAAFGVAGLRCDGMDVRAVERVVGDAVARARAESRPLLVEALVRREVDAVDVFGARLRAAGVDLDERAAAVDATIARAEAFAHAAPEPVAP